MKSLSRRCHHLIIVLVLVVACQSDDKPQSPEIISINPQSGVPSSVVAISGKYLGVSVDQNKVSFNGVNAVILNASPGQVNVMVPPGATTGPISLSVNGRPASNQPIFTIEHPDAIVNSITPDKGGYKTTIKIAGENFYTTASDNSVTVNGVPAIVQTSTANEINFVVPARSGTGDVVVNGVAAVQRFTYIPDVFIAASEESSTPGVLTAKIWKNGIATSLNPAGVTNSLIDMFVDQDDVYAIGQSKYLPTVWKNSTPSELTATFTVVDPYFVSVAGSDVYYGGQGRDKTGNYHAVYWKNGVTDFVSPPSLTTLSVINMEVYSNDPFIVGGALKAGVSYATYWNAKQAYTLSNEHSMALDILHHGSDLYCVGWIDSSTGGATLWKNGVPTSLLPGIRGSSAQLIKIVGDDIYIAGNTSNQSITSVVLWKNGVPIFLSDGTKSEQPVSLDVIGDDVYVLGVEYIGSKSIMKYWKNGTPFYINNGVSAYPVRIIVR